MSASMRQGLADLLVRRTNAARNKADDLLFNVRKDLGASATHAEHKLYSDLLGALDKQLCNADNLLHKDDASYFNWLGALRNLNILRDVTHELRRLADTYGTRQKLQKKITKVETLFKKREAQKKSVPDIGYPRETDYKPLALLVGYFYVGYIYASHVEPYTFDWWVALLLWSVGFTIALLAQIVKGTITSNPDAVSVITTVFSGLTFSVVVYVVGTTINRAKKSKYNTVQKRLNELTRELDELSEEVSTARNSVDTVEREISDYRNTFTQKIKEIKWKSD
ncbi:MAG: hypothetical protein MN733_16110 [Nitrososphaera sp.]|nr:hypothetical protein [Nitrososphaera sp.]